MAQAPACASAMVREAAVEDSYLVFLAAGSFMNPAFVRDMGGCF